jgi:hypothetical protein
MFVRDRMSSPDRHVHSWPDGLGAVDPGQRGRSGSPGQQHPDLAGAGEVKAHQSLREWDNGRVAER